MIESKLAFLQMQIEGLFGYSSGLREPRFSPLPKVFNTFDVIATIRKLIVSMLDSIVFLIAKINQSVVGFEAVRIDCWIRTDLRGDDRIKFVYWTVWNNLSIYVSSSFDQTKHDVFPLGSTTAFTANAFRSEVAFIKLNATFFKDAFLFAKVNNTFSESKEDTIDWLTTDARQWGNFGCFKVKGKVF